MQEINSVYENGRHRIKSYVLRASRMSDAQRRSYNTFFCTYSIPFEKKLLKHENCFGNDNPLVIEIGFGMGIATAQIAENNPHKNYLGIEVHKPGIGRLLWEIENRKLENIRIIEHDGVEVIENMIEDRSVEAFHIFFPDPWHKKRHHKRRLVKRPFTDMLERKLKQSGYIYMVTDWEDYGNWALEELSATPNLINRYEKFALPQTWRPQTKFEKKGLIKQHCVYELFFTLKIKESAKNT